MSSTSRRFRFSLRTLLILVSLAGLALAWVHRARQQHVAVEALRQSNPGISLLYNDRSVVDAEEQSPLRQWLSARLGVDYVETVTGVELFYATDADLALVARLPSLHWLSLVRSVDVTDRGLAELAVLSDLRTLILMDAEQLTDAGLAHLEKLTSLTHLRLDLGRHDASPQAIESLRRALPGCHIEVRGGQDAKPHVALVGRE